MASIPLKRIPVFYKKVYVLLKRTPKGKVVTYKAIAEALNSKAYRAVGNACNKNPFAPKVPCHRVVSSDGSVGGFARGKKAKKLLLKKEGIHFNGEKILNFRKKLYNF